QDHSAIESVLAVELAAAIFEFADLGWAGEHASVAVGPVQIPLVGLRIVETQREAFDVAGGAVRFEFIEIRAAIPDRAGNDGAVKFNPGGGAGQGMYEALQVDFPGANLKVKIVLAVAWR